MTSSRSSPAPARSYELASLSGAESAGILTYLMSVENPGPDVIRAVQGGVTWFRSARIEGFRFENGVGGRTLVEDASAPPLWARFYELETNRPIFCDRDGIPRFRIDEIGEERRNGYAWYGSWGVSMLNAYAKWPHRDTVPSPD